MDILFITATTKVEHQYIPTWEWGGNLDISEVFTWMRSRDAGRLYEAGYETAAL